MTMKKEFLDFIQTLDRSKFLDDEVKEFAKFDTPLPIGQGQTISQPSLVFQMSLLLELNKNCKVLEIGTGSGYQTAILAHFSKEVYTIELIPELSEKAQKTLTELNFNNVEYFIKDGSRGLSNQAPFDRIMVTAGAREVPKELLEQLGNNGIMVIPVGPSDLQTLKVIKKDEFGKITTESIRLVRFVEFKGEYGWDESKNR